MFSVFLQLTCKEGNVDWLLFVIYQNSSIPKITKVRIDEFKYTCTIDYMKQIIKLDCLHVILYQCDKCFVCPSMSIY